MLNKPACDADSGSAGIGDANKGNPWRLASAVPFRYHSLVQLLLNQSFNMESDGEFYIEVVLRDLKV